MDYAHLYPLIAGIARGDFSRLWIHKHYAAFNVVAKYYYPENPRSPSQQGNRILLYDAMYNWRHFDADTKKYYNERTSLEVPWGHNRYLSLYIKANYPMIIYWELLKQADGKDITIPEYMAESYFSGVRRIRSFADYPSGQPYGSVFHHSVFNRLFTFLFGAGWSALPSPAGGGAGITQEYAESENEVNTTSTSYQDKTTLQFTPSEAGDWLIFATAEFRNATNGRKTYVDLDQDAGTQLAEVVSGRWVPAADEFNTFSTIKKVTLDTSEHTFKIRYKTENASYRAYIRKARIFALKL